MNKKGIFVIHGFIQSVEDMEAINSYLPVNTDYEVYPISLPGHGSTGLAETNEKDWIEFSKEQFIKFKEEYDEQIIIGYSMGGVIATMLASLYGCEKLVLIAPSYHYISLSLRKLKALKSEELSIMINSTLSKKLTISALKSFIRCVKYCDKKSKKLSMPLRVFYGIDDILVDEKMLSHVLQKCTHDDRKAILYGGHGHAIVQSDKYVPIFKDICDFINE